MRIQIRERRRVGGYGLLALVAGMLVPALAAAVTVSREIEFTMAGKLRAELREQCQLQTRIPEAIAANSAEVELVDGEGELALEITEVHAPGGWVFSGPKWIQVNGRLTREGKVLAFRAKRFSAFNPFAGGTCGILASISRAIGSDIAAWLENPTPNAELGDAR